ncbi:MAG: hypothetical protein IPI29_06500 [Ignavibacteria bacterium]|nr:hypothetical protein [Ignavibacteria bacterium]
MIQWNHATGAQQRVVVSLSSPIVTMRCIGSDSIIVATRDGITRCILSSDGSNIWQFSLGSDAIRSIDVHHSHHKIAVGTINGMVYTVDPLNGTATTIPLQVSASNSPIVDVAFGNDNTNISLILAACADGEMYSTIPSTSGLTPLRHYDRPGRCVARYDDVIALGWSGSITTSYVSPDPLSASLLSIVEPNASIRTIDMVTGMVPPPIPVNNIIDRTITSIAWHPNGTLLYAASGNNLSLIDVPTRNVVLQTDLDAPANEVSVSPLGTQVVIVQSTRTETRPDL